jgi:integrase/recombinase XerD
MSRPQSPFVVQRRKKVKTFMLTINPSSGVPARICAEWQRKSFQNLPLALAQYREPKSQSFAEAGAFAFIEYLKKAEEPVQVATDRITVGAWMEKFTRMAGNPRGARIVAENRPYSINTIIRYECLYRVWIKDDPISKLLMQETEEADALEYISRLANKKMDRKDLAYKMAGTETFEKVIKFLRMAFKEYQRQHQKWHNPFRDVEPPKNTRKVDRDALTEDEVVSLFGPGVLNDVMELAVAASMFMAGLRRGEVFSLKPEDLDWWTPQIHVRRAWQNFDRKAREMGPTKSHVERLAPFDEVLQAAIKKLWRKNGQHEYVFSFADGTTPGPSWTKGRFKKWITRAGIKLNGRKITPHSSRHSLASLLEARGVSLRYIQDLLGHSDLKTTKTYLHSTEATIRDVGKKIGEAMQGPEKQPDNVRSA